MMRPVARHSMSKRVLSTIGVFGGAQAVTIFCSLIRIKLVALWIARQEWDCLAFITPP